MSDKLRDSQLELFTAFEKMEGNSEKSIVKVYAQSLVDYKKYIAGLFEDYEEEGKLTYDEMIKYGRLGKMDEVLKGLTVSLYSDSAKEIKTTLETAYTKGYEGTSEIISHAWGNKSLIPIIKDEEMQRALTNEISGLKWTDRMGIHREHAAGKIRETVVRGLHDGETYAQMANRLETALGKDVPNPLGIVRTESYRVFSQARKDRLDKVKGVGMTKEWITSLDEAVRSNHAPMNGVKVPYNDDFILPNGNGGFGPGLIGSAADDINCRCIWIMDIMEDETVDPEEYVDYESEDEIPEVYSEITNSLSDESKKVLEQYTGFTGSDVNSAIRRGSISEKTQGKIDLLDKALEGSALPENVVLKRGAVFNCYEELKHVRDIREVDTSALIGKRLTDRAYTSTSLLEPLHHGRDIIMTINAPKGSNGLYLEPVAYKKYKDQHEILLSRGCSFQVKTATIEGNKLVLEVDLKQ